MKNNFLHKIIALWTVVILLLPIGVQLFHTLENHEHKICDSKINKHFHQQKIDCSFYHLQNHTNTIFVSNSIDFDQQIIFIELPTYLTKTKKEVQLFCKSSRAPPFFIV